jgi:predicted dehydrogenase
MMLSEKMNLRFGLIGTGYWATTVHGASVGHHPGVDFVGVWGRDATKTSDAARQLGTRPYADVEALLADVDALTFAVPPDVQAEIATRAARGGRHILLEKPVATSLADAARLEKAVDDARIASIVFFTRRFVPETQVWLQHLDKQGGWECGRAEFAANVEGGPFGAAPWRHEKGGLWDVGPHALAQLVPVLGDVTSVLAGAGRRDQVHLVMSHSNARSSTASLSLTVPAAGTGTTIYFYGESGRETAPATPLGTAGIVSAHQAAIDALIGQIEQPGSGHACDIHFGVRVVEILAAAEESLTTGRRVDTPR